MTGRAQNRKLWMIGGALLAVAIVLVGWFVVVNPQLSSAADIRDQTEAVTVQNAVLQAKNTKLRRDNDQVANLRAGLAAALAQLPSDGGLPEFTRQLSNQATARRVSLTSVIVGAVAPVAAGAPAAAAQTAAGTEPSAAAAPTPPAGAAASLIQIPISLVVNGPGRGDIAFLKDIQITGPRRALVTSSQLTPLAGGAAAGIDGPCTLTLSITIFSAPLQPAAAAALATLLSGK